MSEWCGVTQQYVFLVYMGVFTLIYTRFKSLTQSLTCCMLGADTRVFRAWHGRKHIAPCKGHKWSHMLQAVLDYF